MGSRMPTGRPADEALVPSDEERLNYLLGEWEAAAAIERQREQGVVAEEVAAWESTVLLLSKEQQDLQAQGRWVRGRSDYLGVLSLARAEVKHSAMIAWLLDPIGSHGLGLRFLDRLLGRCYDPPPDVHPGEVTTECEVVGRDCRADIIVSAPMWTLVIENKVDAVEGPEQCGRLYRAFSHRADPRFVFLSPRGGAPKSIVCREDDPGFEVLSPEGSLEVETTCDAKVAWRPLGYAKLRQDLVLALNDLDEAARQRAGTSIVVDYLRTLEREFR